MLLISISISCLTIKIDNDCINISKRLLSIWIGLTWLSWSSQKNFKYATPMGSQWFWIWVPAQLMMCVTLFATTNSRSYIPIRNDIPIRLLLLRSNHANRCTMKDINGGIEWHGIDGRMKETKMDGWHLQLRRIHLQWRDHLWSWWHQSFHFPSYLPAWASTAWVVVLRYSSSHFLSLSLVTYTNGCQ